MEKELSFWDPQDPILRAYNIAIRSAELNLTKKCKMILSLQTSKYVLTFGVWYDFGSHLLTSI